jgi:hypothetical protein
MKQLNSDFSKAKVGDPVYYLDGSVGEITFIHTNNPYPIQANNNERYTIDGKFTSADTFPFIFTHPFKIVRADDEPFVERVMEVSNEEDFSDKEPRVVFAQKCGYYVAWVNAKTIKEAENQIDSIPWKFAREIQPVNPRIAEIERDIQRLQNELETLKEVSNE